MKNMLQNKAIQKYLKVKDEMGILFHDNYNYFDEGKNNGKDVNRARDENRVYQAT